MLISVVNSIVSDFDVMKNKSICNGREGFLSYIEILSLQLC